MILRSLTAVSLSFALAACSTASSPEPTPTASQPSTTPVIEPTASPTPAIPPVKISYNSVLVDGPYIAITFDDGPHATNTPALLDLLKRKNVKATFYVVGQNVQEYPAIAKRIVEEGHEIANHSWSHSNLSRMSDSAVRNDLTKTNNIIEQVTGVKVTNMRPPYGAITQNQKKWFTHDLGLKVILWDVDPFDWKRPGPLVVTHRIVEGTKPGSIILAHDIHEPTVRAMETTLDRLLAKGFKFVTVSELLAMEKPAPTPTPTPEKKESPKTSPVQSE